ncbi:ABC transporter [Corynespora cassiicola Philippines]|uniref:ABC transporter n=1 Tax=Corynespora cassiicola Philippines TaxID=1448308 RepID=A0A2T2NXN6_CORCC|nr:ABC transporter [Corynespora cassiicola Philippines]
MTEREICTPAGVAFHDLDVFGHVSQTHYQKTFGNYPLSYLERLWTWKRRKQIRILRNLGGVIKSGEMVLVLGRPGSGCTTLLKTLSGQTDGLIIGKRAIINYHGIEPTHMHNEFRGQCIYEAEIDVHFPLLNVQETLEFATECRAPANILEIEQFTRKEYTDIQVKTAAECLGLSKVLDTQVGNDFIPGISGGERKRTSIAEILVGHSLFQCWDNPTRGLDSANALQFIEALHERTKADGSAALVSLYQTSEDIFLMFDKVLVLHEGREIFFGATVEAKPYFMNLGFQCSARTPTPEFLTSVTDPRAIIQQHDDDNKLPRTADELERAWNQSYGRKGMIEDIEAYEAKYPLSKASLQKMRSVQRGQKTYSSPFPSPYMASMSMQVKLCLARCLRRQRQDMAATLSAIIGNAIISIILGSMFYRLSPETSSFFSRGALIFFMVLLNSTRGSTEGITLWDQRSIVEKHFRYASHRPVAEAIASIIGDLPTKVVLVLIFNFPVYFLANLRRTAGAFFTFCIFAFAILLTGSMTYRSFGALSRTLSESIAPGAMYGILLIITTGFMIPLPYMPWWIRWFSYINPTFYGFESLMINEFAGRQFFCSYFIPSGIGYEDINPEHRMCTVVGATQNSSIVSGDAYIAESFGHYASHKWRNLGIIFALMAFWCGVYLTATQLIVLQKSRGEILLFRRSKLPQHLLSDTESLDQTAIIHEKSKVTTAPNAVKDAIQELRTATFLWDGLNYDVKINKNTTKRVLDDVEGFVRPGTLTMLMGPSGAGKTSLLNALSDRTITGTMIGDKQVDMQFRNAAFARKIGYVQQQDLHVPTSTVREALQFSALLRQSNNYSKQEKLDYAEKILDLLDMQYFADAIIGVPGEGLNVEQRKRVTIGVELAARPELLLFLDEPTSGLDSDTARSICNLLRKLAEHGHTILCTIHQPSALLMGMFDRLIFLDEGKLLYFGHLGENMKTMTNYFERNGARKCSESENPAEWLMNITKQRAYIPPCKTNDIRNRKSYRTDWVETWRLSEERMVMKNEMMRLKVSFQHAAVNMGAIPSASKYASPFTTQLYLATKRAIQSDLRTPSYLWSKALSAFGMSFVNGLAFYHSANTYTIQEIQNQVFSVFVLLTVFSTLTQLIMANFIAHRTLYETRERPSRTFSWPVLLLSRVIAELYFQTFLATAVFLTWYFLTGLFKHAGASSSHGGGLIFLLLWSFLCFTTTFSIAVVTIMPNAATGVNIATLLYMMSLLFCGVLVAPSALPGFWIFMYRVTPLSYFVSPLVTAGLRGVDIECAGNEFIEIAPFPANTTCSEYLAEFLKSTPARLINPMDREACRVCPVKGANNVLVHLEFRVGQVWRDWGISVVFSVINVGLALLLYWLVRVPRAKKNEDAAKTRVMGKEALLSAE